MRLIVFFGLLRTDVNKSQNRQSQSWPGTLIRPRSDNVLQPQPRDASLRLFSVNSALSRPSIPTGHWCCRKAFNVSPPPRTFTVCVVVLSPFEAPEERLPPPRRESPLTRHSTADVAQRERWAIRLSCFLDCILITSEKSPSTRLSMSHMLMTHCFASLGESPFYCLCTNLVRWRLQHGEDGPCPRLFNGCRALYHFDGSVKSRLAFFLVLFLWHREPDWR